MPEWVSPEWAVPLACVVNTVVTAWVTYRLVRTRARRQARLEAAREQPQMIADLEEMQQETTAKLREEQRKSASLAADLQAQQARLEEVNGNLQDYERLRQRMGKLRSVRTFHQPVLVLGPLAVGKTSLIKQWHVPWDSSSIEPSRAHRVCQVPVCEIPAEADPRAAEEPPNLIAPGRLFLGLRLHDFPGEIDSQRRILIEVGKETLRLRKLSRKNLGVVLICMLGADEAHSGIRPETNQYYNGQLFRDLRRLFAHGEIDLSKVIVVYNKIDLLRRQLPPGAPDDELLAMCRSGFAATCEPLRGIVDASGLREVLAVLHRDETGLRSEGATQVKGEAIRPMVEAFLGPQAAAFIDSAMPPTWDL
jgi:hypothetical protein